VRQVTIPRGNVRHIERGEKEGREEGEKVGESECVRMARAAVAAAEMERE